MWFFCACLIVFRAQDSEGTWAALQAFSFGKGAGPQVFHVAWWGLFAGLYLMHHLASHLRKHPQLDRVPSLLFPVVYGATWAVALAFVMVDHPPFIYFQF